MNNYHLIPDGNGWKLTREGSDRFLGKFDTKAEAVARSQSLISEGSLKIHTADGAIEEERTYPRAMDPVETPG